MTRKAAIVGGKSLLSYFDRHKYKGQFNPELSQKMIFGTEEKMAQVFTESLSSISYEEGSGELRLGKHKILCFPCDAPYQHWNGIRRFAVGVAWKHNKELVRGGIFLPVDNELYYFEQDKPSKRNNTKIEMVHPLVLKDAFVSIVHYGESPTEHEMEIGLGLKSAGVRWNFSDGVLYSAALLLNNNLSAIILTDTESRYLPLLRLMMECNEGVAMKVKTGGKMGREVYVLSHRGIARGIVEQLSGDLVVNG